MGIDNDISFGELTYEEISEYKTGLFRLRGETANERNMHKSG